MSIILIKAPSLFEKDSPLAVLLKGLEQLSLCTIERAIVLTTDDAHVASLVGLYGEVLVSETFHTGGGEMVTIKTDPVKENQGPTAIYKNGKEPLHEVKVTEDVTTFKNVLTGEVLSLGRMRQLLRYKRLVPKERFISYRKGLVEVFDQAGKLVLRPVKE